MRTPKSEAFNMILGAFTKFRYRLFDPLPKRKTLSSSQGISFFFGQVSVIAMMMVALIISNGHNALTGYIKRYEATSDEDLERIMKSPETRYPGMEGSVESLEWLWNSRFAAVAGDGPGFEAWCRFSRPCLYLSQCTLTLLLGGGAGEVGGSAGDEFYRMHETLLSGFGMPIGELFDLEELARLCSEHSRWTFFVTSQPLKVVGGVGSPPNAIAIF